jgi:hypothetical protein
MVYVRLAQDWTDAGGVAHTAGAMVDVDAVTLAELEASGVVTESDPPPALGGDGGSTDTGWAGPSDGDGSTDTGWAGPSDGDGSTDTGWAGPSGDGSTDSGWVGPSDDGGSTDTGWAGPSGAGGG